MEIKQGLVRSMAVLCVSALLFSCGTRPAEVSTVSRPPATAGTAAALDGASLLKQGYTKISDDAYVLDDSNGSINFVTSGKSGSDQALKYLHEAQSKAETSLNVLSTQNVSKQVLEDAQHRLRSVRGMIDSLKGADTDSGFAPTSIAGLVPARSGGVRPLVVSCTLTNTTASASGGRGRSTYANADVDAIPGNFDGCVASTSPG